MYRATRSMARSRRRRMRGGDEGPAEAPVPELGRRHSVDLRHVEEEVELCGPGVVDRREEALLQLGGLLEELGDVAGEVVRHPGSAIGVKALGVKRGVTYFPLYSPKKACSARIGQFKKV